MNRLVYKKYKNCEDILSIDLHNGYTILAIKSWNRNNHICIVEFRIKENSVDKWDLVNNAENLIFHVNRNTINSTILKQVSTFLEKGFFDCYIKKYEYELKCFDKGNDFFEEKRLGGK